MEISGYQITNAGLCRISDFIPGLLFLVAPAFHNNSGFGREVFELVVSSVCLDGVGSNGLDSEARAKVIGRQDYFVGCGDLVELCCHAIGEKRGFLVQNPM